jgi:hypothetical protein
MDNLEFVRKALEDYGATLDGDGYICKGGRRLSVHARIVRQRLYFYGALSGFRLFSGVTTPQAVSAFVESFYKWERIKK